MRIGMVHFADFGKFGKFGNKKKYKVFVNGSNDRKEHNYHCWITSNTYSDDYNWSEGLRWGTKTALLLKPRYFHHWYT
jgi:hypothetical protein